MRLLQKAGALFRASHPEPVVAVTAATAMLAAASGRGARRAAVATLAVFAGQLFTGWSNDVLDVELDRRAGRTDKPIATGELPRAHALMGMALTLPWGLLLSRGAGRRAPAIHATGLLLAGAYNAGLRATPISFAPYAGAFALLPIYALDEVPPAWALGAAAMLGTAAHLAQVLPDIEPDREAGVLGLPQRLGTRRSALGAAELLAAAAATIGIATRKPATCALAGAGAAVAAVAAAAGLRGRPRLGFRLTTGAAGLLVASYSLALRTSALSR